MEFGLGNQTLVRFQCLVNITIASQGLSVECESRPKITQMSQEIGARDNQNMTRVSTKRGDFIESLCA